MSEPMVERLEQLRHNCEYHAGVNCMVSADTVLALFAERDALLSQLREQEDRTERAEHPMMEIRQGGPVALLHDNLDGTWTRYVAQSELIAAERTVREQRKAHRRLMTAAVNVGEGFRLSRIEPVDGHAAQWLAELQKEAAALAPDTEGEGT